MNQIASRSLVSTALLAACMTFATATAEAQDAPPRLDSTYPNYQPPYPDAAQVNGEQGIVVLDVQVSPSGRVRNVKVNQSSGFGDLDNAAIEGVLRWRYIPAVEGGSSATQWTKVTIAYKLPTATIVPPNGATPPPAPPR
jgi:periplasmic protein TonB